LLPIGGRSLCRGRGITVGLLVEPTAHQVITALPVAPLRGAGAAPRQTPGFGVRRERV